MSSSFNPLIAINEATATSTVNIDDITFQDENFMTLATNSILSLSEDYINNSKNFYKSILESNGDATAIHESYGEFFSTFKKIIDKFLKIIGDLFSKFISRLTALIQGEKYILNHQKELENFSTADQFTTDGYNYSFDPTIPMINLSVHFDSSLIGDLGKLKAAPITKDKTVLDDPAKRAIDKLHNHLKNELNGDYYNIFRGMVLGGSKRLITSKDFSSECFKCYRAGEDAPIDVLVTPTYVDGALSRIKNYKDTIKDIETLKTTIEREYNSISNKLGRMVKPNSTEVSEKLRRIDIDGFDNSDLTFTNVTISYDALSSLDSYLRTLSNQIQEMSSIHTLAFSAKLEAIKEQYQQDNRILKQILLKNHVSSSVDESAIGSLVIN